MDEEPQILLKEGMMKKHMPPPFPQALRGKKPIKNASEILDVLRQVKLFDHQSNPRLSRVLWNPWQSNGKLRNMKNQSFEVLFHKQIRNARRGSKVKSAMKHS
ncbi:hypothetical protein CK203_045658 [Vitis vinifera]|uniref:Uncharacterized protein n=1 Tax=Vitis vinifera TaxID=29760 RepID=A0A438HQ91_VITVI|nr:hypothetical protein CK203_045658 [Vitis vinifera]